MTTLNKNQLLISKLKDQRKLMIDYLKLRLEMGDWHGVQDAASDVREIEAALRILIKA